MKAIATSSLPTPLLFTIYNSRAAELRPWGMGKYTGRQSCTTHDEITQLAYSLYESRGRQEGQDIEDWVRAEQELMRYYA